MNWPKVKEKYPKAYEELRVLSEITGNEGGCLLDQYFEFHNKEWGFLRLPILQEIEDNLSTAREVEITRKGD